jgi:hypothetical protein
MHPDGGCHEDSSGRQIYSHLPVTLVTAAPSSFLCHAHRRWPPRVPRWRPSRVPRLRRCPVESFLRRRAAARHRAQAGMGRAVRHAHCADMARPTYSTTCRAGPPI